MEGVGVCCPFDWKFPSFFFPFFPGHHLGVGYNIYSHVRMLSMKVGHLVLLHVICKCVLSQ